MVFGRDGMEIGTICDTLLIGKKKKRKRKKNKGKKKILIVGET